MDAQISCLSTIYIYLKLCGCSASEESRQESCGIEPLIEGSILARFDYTSENDQEHITSTFKNLGQFHNAPVDQTLKRRGWVGIVPDFKNIRD